MTFSIRNPVIGMQAIATTDTTQNHPLGTIVTADDWVTYNMDDGSTTRIVANAIGPVAIAMSANVANQYGWYQIGGKAQGLCGTTVDSTILFIEAAGRASDSSVTGDRIWGAVSAESVASVTLCDVEIARPFVTNGEL